MGTHSRRRPDGGRSTEGDRVVVLNPVSGPEDHASLVRRLAEERGFDVRETRHEEHAIELAEEAAADGATLVAACGGDGTINEVVYGLRRADALDDVTLAVVPAGTGNNFAGNVGVEGIEHAFEVIDVGERRWIDLGIASTDAVERPFVNSCVGGLTAEASASTTTTSKSRLGIVAYVLTTLRTLTDYDGLRLQVETASDSEAWTGEAITVLIGNGRRFPAEGRTQADMEDGLFDVTIIEEQPSFELAEEAARQRLFGSETEHITRMKARSLDLEVLSGDAVTFSLDGEMLSAGSLAAETESEALELCVGEGYDPHPETGEL